MLCVRPRLQRVTTQGLVLHVRCVGAVLWQVRLACSPDAESYLVVREPAACAYIIVLYTPFMCSHSEYAPTWLLQTSQQQQQPQQQQVNVLDLLASLTCDLLQAVRGHPRNASAVYSTLYLQIKVVIPGGGIAGNVPPNLAAAVQAAQAAMAGQAPPNLAAAAQVAEAAMAAAMQQQGFSVEVSVAPDGTVTHTATETTSQTLQASPKAQEDARLAADGQQEQEAGSGAGDGEELKAADTHDEL